MRKPICARHAKRQGTGALQDASRTREPWPSRQRLGVRRPSAAFPGGLDKFEKSSENCQRLGCGHLAGLSAPWGKRQRTGALQDAPRTREP